MRVRAGRGTTAFPDGNGSFLVQCRSPELLTWNDGQIASALPQIFMPLWAALAVAPLYRLGASVFNAAVARWAVALWPLVPGLAMFTPRFNTFYPLITLVMLV